jgi:hypothetical protein
MKTNIKKSAAALLLATAIAGTSCTKADYNDDVTKGSPPPIGSYTNSSEIAPTDLVAYFPFDGSATDSKGSISGGTLTGGSSFGTGKKGQAYQGTANGFISYANAGALANLTSFTTTMWINTTRHTGGAQGVFAVSKQDGSFWGNFFVIIEGAAANEGMLAKLHFEKNVTPAIANTEQWLETGGNLRSGPLGDMYGNWRHIAFTYDETTSKVGLYVSGNQVTLDSATTNRKASGTTPLGALAFKNATRFVVGGFQNHLGAPYNTPEVWMLPYTGKLDELRFYKKALSGSEINSLFQLELQGR